MTYILLGVDDAEERALHELVATILPALFAIPGNTVAVTGDSDYFERWFATSVFGEDTTVESYVWPSDEDRVT